MAFTDRSNYSELFFSLPYYMADIRGMLNALFTNPDSSASHIFFFYL